MRLTKKKAIELSIEHWTSLAETGTDDKSEWLRDNGYGIITENCFLCEYGKEQVAIGFVACAGCFYHEEFGHCNGDGTAFNKWWLAETPKDRKKYAGLFLEQLKSLIQKPIAS